MVGAGPIGGIVGGRLGRQGNEVTLVDVDPEHVRTIRECGLQIDVPDGNFNIAVPAVFPDEIEGTFDIAFIAVRSYYTSLVLEYIVPHLAEDAVIVSLQNGINHPLIEEKVGQDRVIGTGIRMRSGRIAPGHVASPKRGHLYVGHSHGNTTPRLRMVQTLLDAVIPTEITDNILGVLWSKLTYTCLGFFGSLADASLQIICESARNRRLCLEMFAEVVGVGKAAGVLFIPLAEYDPLTFHPDRPLTARLAALNEMAKHWRRDDRNGPVRQIKRGTRTEVDYTVAQVVREGSVLGIPTPICQGIVNIIHELEQGKKQLLMENYEYLEGQPFSIQLPVTRESGDQGIAPQQAYCNGRDFRS